MRSYDPVGLTGDTDKRTPTEIASIEEGNRNDGVAVQKAGMRIQSLI
jgi:hypothetical protein